MFCFTLFIGLLTVLLQMFLYLIDFLITSTFERAKKSRPINYCSSDRIYYFVWLLKRFAAKTTDLDAIFFWSIIVVAIFTDQLRACGAGALGRLVCKTATSGTFCFINSLFGNLVVFTIKKVEEFMFEVLQIPVLLLLIFFAIIFISHKLL